MVTTRATVISTAAVGGGPLARNLVTPSGAVRFVATEHRAVGAILIGPRVPIPIPLSGRPFGAVVSVEVAVRVSVGVAVLGAGSLAVTRAAGVGRLARVTPAVGEQEVVGLAVVGGQLIAVVLGRR
ncbi:hypothetical protein [Actinokineospora sp. NBRC 105648]|uniref:hypothetical protein n=1 Tax=Actinokineospora sp. NBRC 105648 TaxID=3032206 RepID=UPI002555AE22|nr:hypothetical protein [Actinokineospora sp. NBRC 105648]